MRRELGALTKKVEGLLGSGVSTLWSLYYTKPLEVKIQHSTPNPS